MIKFLLGVICGATLSAAFAQEVTIQHMPDGVTKYTCNGTPNLDDETVADMEVARAIFNLQTGDDPTAQQNFLVDLYILRRASK